MGGLVLREDVSEGEETFVVAGDEVAIDDDQSIETLRQVFLLH